MIVNCESQNIIIIIIILKIMYFPQKHIFHVSQTLSNTVTIPQNYKDHEDDGPWRRYVGTMP